MNSEEAVSLESVENRVKSPDDICVLLLDGDPTCLMIISKMLQKSGYRVMTAERATDALCIIRDKDIEIDLIMAETHLPDMDKYELLETIGGISDLPVVIMAADRRENTMLGCLFKGAAFYLLKPLVMDDLKNLWQFAVKSKRKVPRRLNCDPPEQNLSDDDPETPLLADELNQDRKRKERPAETENNGEDYETYELGDQKKKPKLIWTDELQDRFSQAIKDLGSDGAYPDKILQHLNVPGLTEEDILAHIQEQGVIEITAVSQTAPDFPGGFLQFPETGVPFLGPANLQSQEESSNNAALKINLLENLRQNGTNPGGEELELIQGEINVSDIAELAFESLLDFPDILEDPARERAEDQQQRQELLLPQEAQASSSDVPKKSTQELIDEIFNDLW